VCGAAVVASGSVRASAEGVKGEGRRGVQYQQLHGNGHLVANSFTICLAPCGDLVCSAFGAGTNSSDAQIAIVTGEAFAIPMEDGVRWRLVTRHVLQDVEPLYRGSLTGFLCGQRDAADDKYKK